VTSRKPQPPYVTYSLIAVNLSAFFLENWLGDSQELATLYRLGALVQEEVVLGEWWRVITANFLHFGWGHLLTNMFGLYILGKFTELSLGRIRYTIVYFLSGVGAMALYIYWSLQVGISRYLLLGASAAIMGLVGAIAAVFLRDWLRERNQNNSQKLQQIILLILLQFALDRIMPQVSSLSHLFGLGIGFILGIILGKRKVLNLQIPKYARRK
jgi:rhomboid protease GluP